MKFSATQQKVKIIAVIIVTVFVFTFLHSEFGFLTPQHHTHQSHDYCDLINGATIQIQKTLSISFVKQTVIKEVCFHCLEEDFVHYQKTQSQRIEGDFLKTFFPTDLCIKNSTLLI